MGCEHKAKIIAKVDTQVHPLQNQNYMNIINTRKNFLTGKANNVEINENLSN
mgnify:CR=1 FL=1